MTLPALRPADLACALEVWGSAIGSGNVHQDADTREQLETATYRVTRHTLGMLRPATREEVQECLRIANQFRVPLYPVSRGRNWGLGSRVPAMDGCMVLDLSRLDRIVDFSEAYAYLCVEPGVTFSQAWEYLQERHSRLMLNTTLGPPDGSLIGNAVERGHGSGMYLNRFQYVCGLEVVLPNGELLRTGLRRSENAHAARLHRWGSGPYVDGLFSQSNLGIVTEMTFWLHPLPADVTDFECHLEGQAQIDAAIEIIRELRFDPRFRCGFSNVHRLTFDERAWRGEGEVQQRTQADVRDPALYLCMGGGLHCQTALEGWALRRRVMAALRGKVKGLRYLSPLRRVFARSLRGPLRRAGVEIPDSALDVRLGAPSAARVASMYAAKAHGPRPAHVQDVDLDRDRCGVMWYCPVVPFSGCHMREVMAICERIGAAFAFQPQLTFVPHNPRSLDAFVALVYDRADDDLDNRARQCYDGLVDALSQAGYPPYRVPVDRMDAVVHDAPEYASFLSKLKQALDPNDILAPGRYDGRSEPRH